jgi:hypothetical protein
MFAAGIGLGIDHTREISMLNEDHDEQGYQNEQAVHGDRHEGDVGGEQEMQRYDRA